MAFSLVTSGGAQSADTLTATTAALDTTGAGLLVVYTAGDNLFDAVVTDSKGNTWTPLVDAPHAPDARWFYCANPTVGSGHTFTVSDAGSVARLPSLGVLAFSHTGLAVFHQETGLQTNGTTAQPGSQTPTSDNALVVQGITFVLGGGVPTIDGTYTIPYSAAYAASVANGIAVAYDIQTTAATTNPTWTFGSFAFTALRSASFTEVVAIALSPGVGSLVLAGQAPLAISPLTIAIPVGSLVLDGPAPTSNATNSPVIGVPPGSLLLTGLSPTPVFSHVYPDPGGLVLTGQVPSILFGGLGPVDVPPGSLVLQGYAPVSYPTATGDVSQLGIEFIQAVSAPARVSTLGAEFILRQTPNVIVSQLIVEIIRRTITITESCPSDWAIAPATGPPGCPTGLPLAATVVDPIFPGRAVLVLAGAPPTVSVS
jgi:hypothetical protein